MKTIFLAGGGTGGHVYPALAIANAIYKLQPDVKIHFIGTQRGIENKVIPKTPYTLHLVSMGRFNNIGFVEKVKLYFFCPLPSYNRYF